MYTVQRCINRTRDAATKQQIQESLGPLICCQHLSFCWLRQSVSTGHSSSMPLAQLEPQLKQLISLCMGKYSITNTTLIGMIQSQLDYQLVAWPANAQPAHSLTVTVSASTVHLTWEIAVGTLRETAQRSRAEAAQASLPAAVPPGAQQWLQCLGTVGHQEQGCRM